MLSIPPEVTSEAVNHPVEGPELIHFRNFFEVWDGFAALNAVRAAEPVDSSAQKLQTLEWRRQYGVSEIPRMRATVHLPFSALFPFYREHLGLTALNPVAIVMFTPLVINGPPWFNEYSIFLHIRSAYWMVSERPVTIFSRLDGFNLLMSQTLVRFSLCCCCDMLYLSLTIFHGRL